VVSSRACGLSHRIGRRLALRKSATGCCARSGRALRHVQYLSLSFHTRAKTGDLVVRVISDVGMLQEVAVTALIPTVAKALIVAGMIGVDVLA